jgi:hypothetical protein
MLGFDALGRLALGEGILVGVTNTILSAAAGSFAETGIAASFSVLEATGGTSYALTGNAAAFQPQLHGVAASYAETGNAAAFAVLLPGVGASYALTGGAATFAARLATGGASYAETGNAAAFSVLLTTISGTPANVPVVGGFDGLISSRAALGQVSQLKPVANGYGTYSLAGAAANFSPGEIALGNSFIVTGDPALFGVQMPAAARAYLLTGNAATLTRDFINWLPANSIIAPWAAESAPSNPWSPVTAPTTTWTSDPAMLIPSPVSQ